MPAVSSYFVEEAQRIETILRMTKTRMEIGYHILTIRAAKGFKDLIETLEQYLLRVLRGEFHYVVLFCNEPGTEACSENVSGFAFLERCVSLADAVWTADHYFGIRGYHRIMHEIDWVPVETAVEFKGVYEFDASYRLTP